MRKDKIALHGSYYDDNFGDSLFFLFFIEWLLESENISRENIVLPYAGNRVRKLANVSNMKGLKSLLMSRKIVFVGGGYLGERPTNKLRWNIRYLVRHVSLGLFSYLLKKPYIFIGVGAGPLTNPISRKLTVSICNHSYKTIVRDNESFNYLLKYGVKEEKLIKTADSILTLDQTYIDRIKPQKLLDSQSVKDKTRIGVHLTYHESKADKIDFILDSLCDFCKIVGDYEIVVFNDFYIDDYSSDIENKLRSQLDPTRVSVEHYDNPEQLVLLLNSLDIILTTKLHCGIVANCLNKFTLAFPIHDKTLRFYNQINQLKRVSPLTDVSRQKVDLMFEEYFVYDKSYQIISDEIRVIAMRNKNELISFIRDNKR